MKLISKLFSSASCLDRISLESCSIRMPFRIVAAGSFNDFLRIDDDCRNCGKLCFRGMNGPENNRKIFDLNGVSSLFYDYTRFIDLPTPRRMPPVRPKT